MEITQKFNELQSQHKKLVDAIQDELKKYATTLIDYDGNKLYSRISDMLQKLSKEIEK